MQLRSDVERCLLTDRTLLVLSQPDAAGYLDRRSSISGWYRYWFSLRGSQLLYFERGQFTRRGLLVDVISLFRHKLMIVNSIKRKMEFEITEASGRVHVLRANSDSEMLRWARLFETAKNKIPPARPIDLSIGSSERESEASRKGPLQERNRSHAYVGSHLKVDHLLCVVHGIGVSSDMLASNMNSLRECFSEVMSKVFPDVEFQVEFLVTHWRNALTGLDVHRRLRAAVPVAPVDDDANPLRQFMVHRMVDYVYYTHDRYRRHILREVAAQLNSQVESFLVRRPDFNGKISVVGHSLGAALCYDLMCRKVHDDQVLLDAEGMRLNFDAANLFCLGNPLGTLLGLDPTIGLGADMRKLPFRVVNVFKYHDPLATRLEPHCDVSAVNMPPVTVPCWFNMGLRESTAQWLGTFLQSGKKREAEGEGDGLELEIWEKSGAPLQGNGEMSTSALERHDCSSSDSRKVPSALVSGEASISRREGSLRGSDTVLEAAVRQGTDLERNRRSNVDVMAARAGEWKTGGDARIDFALQASSAMEDVSTSWSALRAHTEYWGNRDAMLLMVSTMMKSTFGFDNGGEGEHGREMERRIVNDEVLRREARSERVMTGGVTSGGAQGTGKESACLELVVEQIVERMVDEAVATHALIRRHPEIRVRSGGISGRSPAGSRVEEETGVKAGGGGWASYLGGGWFRGGSKAQVGWGAGGSSPS